MSKLLNGRGCVCVYLLNSVFQGFRAGECMMSVKALRKIEKCKHLHACVHVYAT